ncbi:5-nitroimidazole antibiotic resistance protein [Apiospora sp. TS-2023a]
MADQPYVEVYKKTAQNSVLRCPSRARYDVHTVHSIINSAPLAHVGFINPETLTPVVLPMIARIGDYKADQDCASGSNQANVSVESCQGNVSVESCQGNAHGNGHTTPNGDAMDTAEGAAEGAVEDTVACYLHGSAAARLFREGDGMGNGIPVCIEATKILGLVLTLTPFSHTYDYRSAILHGRATILNPENSSADRAEVLWALKLLTDGILPERWVNCRTPPDDFELMSTRILKVRIDSASAKVRNHGVDEQPKDLKPTERANIMRTWTGVIPHLELLGEPQPARCNMVRHPPSYITDHVKKHNEEELARSQLAH